MQQGLFEPSFSNEDLKKLEIYKFKLKKDLKKGIYWGTSSWKYESWWNKGLGPFYFGSYTSTKDFESRCLEEYASVFTSVSGDFSFYSFPRPELIQTIQAQTPNGFEHCLKCTDEITLSQFPALPRFGAKAGKQNPNFLNPTLFLDKFYSVATLLGNKLGPINLEFTAFSEHQLTSEQFYNLLSEFTRAVKKTVPEIKLAIEIRNRSLCNKEHFYFLKSEGLIPVLNHWTKMPSLKEQWQYVEPFDFDSIICRALMKPGRLRTDAVKLFEPYDRIRERQFGVRETISKIYFARKKNPLTTYFLINNHLEGCAYQSAFEIIDLCQSEELV